MPRHIGKAAVVALATLLLGTQAVAALGGIGGVPRSSIDPAVRPERTLSALAARVELLDAAVASSVGRLDPLGGRVATLEAEIRAASADRTAAQRRVVRGTDAARERVVAWRPSGRPTLEELSQPLEDVATALHAGDEHRGSLLAEVGDLAVRAADVEALRAETAATAFELGRLRTELAAEATLAIRTEWAEGEDADRLLDHVRALTERVDSATMALRQQRARILTLTTSLTEERDAIRDDIQGARAAEAALVEGLVSADGTIRALAVSILGDSPWGPFADGVLEVCPVDMPNAYTDDWGAPRYAGGYHPHQGNDIFAPEETPIRAPFAGIAVAVPNTLGGEAVKVYGAAGYVYNAHLSAYGLLGPVETGDVIGYVGTSGDARFSPPHDHFEWHPGGGDAVNPFEMLNAACRPA